MKKNIYFYNVAFALSLLTVITNCAAVKSINDNMQKEKNTQQIKCLTPDYKKFTLEWGYDFEAANEITGYQLNENGNVFLYRQDKQTKQKTSDFVGNVEMMKICEMLEKLNMEMIKMPVINEPGKELSFIILNKPNVGMTAKFTWNEHKTFGSKGFRELFDSLQTIVSTNLKNKKNNKIELIKSRIKNN